LSPKYSSLAYDDIKEQEDQEVETRDPVFNLIINKLLTEDVSPSSAPVKVRGRITVSF
jgi:hypothetical protein